MQQLGAKRSRTRRWLLRWPRALPLAIFSLISLITLVSIYAIELGQAQRDMTQLSARATAITAALERRANASSAYLRAGAALLATMEDVPADDFRRFVSELRLDADYRGAEGIGWAPVVRPDEVAEYNAFAARTGPVPFTLYPQPRGDAPFSAPVTYLQPDTERNRRALGFDMYSEPVRRAAMDEAWRTSRPTASEKIVLLQEGGEEAPGFLIYMPVFASSPEGRVLRGFIYSPFNADAFLQNALELEDAGAFGVRLYDGNPGEATLLASTLLDDGPVLREVRHTVTIANNPSVLVLSARGQTALTGLSMVTLLFGLLVAMLLMLLLRMLIQQAQEDEASLQRFEEQASIRNTLTRELNHRVKNTLANVLSIIALTRRRATSLEEFATGLDGRIRALSATHDLLTQSDWGATPLGAVVRAELLPYTFGEDQKVEMAGPELDLAPNDALSLGLAVHELATNAAKYGALSTPEGKVTVTWRALADNLVQVEWCERGGPPVPQERGRGFGTDLIERIVAHELRHPVELDFDPAGVRCVLRIPVRQRGEFAIRAGKANTPQS
ncbi:CHASE domain-containing protein [Erythrobacter sp. EC-HK427]|uniref:CHASE domain-containing protein n=1 Tax=Erythrobacter sp. EC-HK427 TaxID=2038396 RepID=UPI0030DC596F